MDDWVPGKSDHDWAAPQSEPADQTLLETCWRIRTPSERIIVCGIYQDAAPGFVLRAMFEHGEILRHSRTPHMEEARLRAAEWLDAIRSTTGFEELMA